MASGYAILYNEGMKEWFAMENDFDWSGLSDADVEQRMDEIIEKLRPDLEADDAKISVLNDDRMRQLEFTYLVMRYLPQGTDAVVSYKLNEPFKTMGSVSVEGKSLEFDNPKWFSRAAEFASNTEVYPLANDRVRLTFTFHGLTKLVQ